MEISKRHNFFNQQVIEHLRGLGYTDVPKDVVDEFLAELRKEPLLQKSSPARPKPEEPNPPQFAQHRGPIIEKNETSAPLSQRNENLNRQPQPAEKGFSPPRYTLKENDIAPQYERPMRLWDQKPPAYEPPSRKPRKKIAIKVKRKTRGSDDLDLLASRRMRKRKSPPMESRRPRTSHGRIRKRSRRGRIVVGSGRFGRRKVRHAKWPKYRRKSDPVGRFHQLNGIWGKDKFLSGNNKNRRKLRYQVRQEMLDIRMANQDQDIL